MLNLILRIYLIFLAPLTYFQRSLIYHPNRCDRLYADGSGLPQAVVDVTVNSHDGLELHGWLAVAGVPAGSETSVAIEALSSDRPVVLFFPGNAGNRSMRYQQMSTLGWINAHVLLVDYRGYGDNTGKPSEKKLSSDARSVWNYLTGELKAPPHRVVIYGESLGGGVATRLASELCQEGIEPGGLIIQSTFSSLVAAAQFHFRFVPVSMVLVDRFPSDQRIGRVTCPILQIHGKQDSIVPFEIGQRLFDVAPAKSSSGIPKRQIVMPNTDHNNVYEIGKDKALLNQELENFLTEVIRQPRPDVSGEGKSGNSDMHQKPVVVEDQPTRIDWTIVISSFLVLLVVLLTWLNRTRLVK